MDILKEILNGNISDEVKNQYLSLCLQDRLEVTLSIVDNPDYDLSNDDLSELLLTDGGKYPKALRIANLQRFQKDSDTIQFAMDLISEDRVEEEYDKFHSDRKKYKNDIQCKITESNGNYGYQK